MANRIIVKKKVGSAKRVTRLTVLPFCYVRVTLLAVPTFLHTNTLACPAGSTRSRYVSKYIRVLLARAKGSTIFSVESAGR